VIVVCPSYWFFLCRFVTFGTEEDARIALQTVSGTSFEGAKIRVGIKTETAAKFTNTRYLARKNGSWLYRCAV
jgi:RNA recognition motif-containing protein